MPPKKWFFLSRKKARQLVSFIRSLISVLVFIGIVTGLFFVFKGKLFRINKLTCQKEGFPCQKEIIFLEELKGQSIFLANTTEISQKIKNKILTVKEVEIKKRLPDRVLIEIIPRQPFVALTKDEKTYFLIDEDGFVYQKVLTKPKNLALIIIDGFEASFYLGQRMEDEVLVKSLSFIKGLKKSFIVFKQIVLSENGTITLFLNEPIIASFSAKKNILSQVDSLQFILRQSKIEGKIPALIDFRFNKPVVKY